MKFLLLLLILSFSHTNSEPTVIVIGNKYLPTEVILQTLRGGGPEKVLVVYKSQGFLKASVSIKGDTVLISEGPQFRVGRITLKGNSVFKDSEIFPLLRIRPGAVFSEIDFNQDMETILSKYENSGYLFCKIKPFDFELVADSVNFGLEIIEGPLVRIRNISVQGNKTTKDYVIIRETRIKLGDIFQEKELHEAQKRLRKLKFLAPEKIDLISQDELEIMVNEYPMTHVEGILGYREQQVLGMFDLELFNIFGTGRELGISWQKLRELSTFIGVNYCEPWILGLPLDISFKGSHRIEDTTYVKNTAELLISAPLSLSLEISCGLSGTWVDGKELYSSEEYRGIVGVNFDTRDGEIAYQRKTAVHYRLRSEFNFKRLDRVEVRLDNYLFLSPLDLFFLSINGSKIFIDFVPEYERFKLGGSRTLRGYWEEEFQGTSVGWLNLEYRRFIGVESFIFPFYDVGYVDGEIKHGWGFGAALKSPIGVITLVYALAPKVTFMEGKVHLSIRSSF